MSKKIDLGVKPEKTSMDMPEVATASQMPRYPSFYIEKELPLSSKDIGTKIEAIVTVRLKSRDERVDDKKKKKYSYQFEVLGIEFDADNGHVSADPMMDRKMKM